MTNEAYMFCEIFYDEVKTDRGTYCIDTRIPFDSNHYETGIWVERRDRMVGHCVITETYPANWSIDQVKDAHKKWVRYCEKNRPVIEKNVYSGERLALIDIL